MPYCVGVDLGTTSVTAAVCDEAGIRVIALGDRTADTPSAVYLQHDGTLITGRRAASKSVTNPGRVARQFTRLLGSPDPVVIGGQPFTPSELLGVLLGNVVHQVTTLEGAPPDSAVLAHPAGWGSARQDLLREVAAGAGLPDPTLVSAPAAVAANWAAGRDADDASVAVYDLGGGTFDAAVLRGPGMSTADGAVPGASGMSLAEGAAGSDLGGMDFDEQLLRLVDSSLRGAVSALDTSDPSNATTLARIRQDCIRAKEALSGVPEAYVPVFLPGRHADVRVRRADLEKLIGAQIGTTADELAAALASAGVEARELSAVLLVGGSARIPLVARSVSERLGRVVTVDSDSPFAVAAGAAAIGGAARGWPVATRERAAPTAAADWTTADAATGAGEAACAASGGNAAADGAGSAVAPTAVRGAAAPTGVRGAEVAAIAGGAVAGSGIGGSGIGSSGIGSATRGRHAGPAPATAGTASTGGPATGPAEEAPGTADTPAAATASERLPGAEPAHPIGHAKRQSSSGTVGMNGSSGSSVASSGATDPGTPPTPGSIAGPDSPGAPDSGATSESATPDSSEHAPALAGEAAPSSNAPVTPTTSGSGPAAAPGCAPHLPSPRAPSGRSPRVPTSPTPTRPAPSTTGSSSVRPASAASVMPAVARATPPPERSVRGHSPEEARRQRVLAIAGGVLAVVVIGLWVFRPWQDSTPGPSTAELVLTTNTVHIQASYYAYASGFQPGEPVELSWTGPTNGVMGPTAPADDTGALRHGPIMERDPAGTYKIVARGLSSGWTASAPLEVLPER